MPMPMFKVLNVLKNSVVYGGLSLISLTAGASKSAINGSSKPHRTMHPIMGFEFFQLSVYIPVNFVSSVSAIVICAATRNPYSIGVSAFFYVAGYKYNHYCINK